MSKVPQRMHDRPVDSEVKQPAQDKGDVILTGLIGSSIQASGSPAMHMQEGRESGLDYSYKLFDLDFIEGGQNALPRVLDQVEREGYAGVNITHPCKQAVIPLLHELSPGANSVGAVNTVVFKSERRIGHNTDCHGFSEGLSHDLPNASLDRVAVLGAGGGGAAVAFALLQRGAKVVFLHDVDEGKALALTERLQAQFPHASVRVSDSIEAIAESCSGVVNCTPIGMAKYPGTPISAALLRPHHWVGDIVYFPLETDFLRAARALGCQTLDGGAMAVFQAAEAFRLFTGRTPDYARMLQRFRQQRQ